jgi:hypothetical protein
MLFARPRLRSSLLLSPNVNLVESKGSRRLVEITLGPSTAEFRNKMND